MRRTSVLPEAKPWRKGGLIPPAQVKRNGVPTGRDPWGVKGHAENPYNNRCDEMAVSEWQKLK